VKNVRRDINVVHLFVGKVSMLERSQFRDVERKCAKFSTTVGGLNRNSKEKLS
jgi:hypothetical protein